MSSAQHSLIFHNILSWCLQKVTNHSANNTVSHPRTPVPSALVLLWELQISKINHMDGLTSLTLSKQNAEIFLTVLAGSSDCVAYCLKWKQCSIIRWTLFYQFLEIPHSFFHTLTSRFETWIPTWSDLVPSHTKLPFSSMTSGILSNQTTVEIHSSCIKATSFPTPNS